MEPLVRTIFTTATIDNNVIVACEVPELSYYEKPCYYKGKAKGVRNPFIASNMEILMETENRHSGIPTIYEEMDKAGLLPPKFENKRDSFKVTLYNIKKENIYNEIDKQKILDYCSKPRSKKELAEHFGFDKDRPTFFVNTYVIPLIELGLLKYTIPNKIKSKNQQIVVFDYKI